MSQSKKPIALAIGATLAGGLMLSGSAFASTQLAQGYLLGAQDAATADAAADKAKEGSCGGDKKAGAEGKCGEGKCGVAEMDTDKDGKVSRAEFDAKHADKAGKAEKFDSIDTNKDGFVDTAEVDAHHAERKASGDKADMEGKCGEGKCGGSI